MRSALDALVTEKALAFIAARRSLDSDLPDMLEDSNSVVTKNVCAKVSVQLADELDEVCGLLRISKRRFIEAAFVDAVDRANAIIADEGVWQELEEQQAHKKSVASLIIHSGDK